MDCGRIHGILKFFKKSIIFYGGLVKMLFVLEGIFNLESLMWRTFALFVKRKWNLWNIVFYSTA